MKVRNRIINYLRGDRRGKEANSLEKEALNDAFLYEALEGLTGKQREVVRDIEYLSKRLRERTRSKWKAIGRTWGIVIALVVAGFVMVLGLRRMQTDGIHRQEKQTSLAGNETPGKGTGENVVEYDTTLLCEDANRQQVNANPDTVRIQQKNADTKPIPPALHRKADTVIEGNRGSVPFGGYKKFYRYIRDSLRYPQDALERGLEGETKLSFYVNKAGRPSHIRVVKWITRSCNREAIRLLSEGPAWNYTGDTSYVVIPFRLEK